MTEIKLSDPTTWPQPGTAHKHHSGRVYVIVDYTNVEADRQDQFPTTIVYANLQSNKKYSRPLVEWGRSFTPMSP